MTHLSTNVDTWLNALGLAMQFVGVCIAAARFFLFEVGAKGTSVGERLAASMGQVAATSGSFGMVPPNRVHAVLAWSAAWSVVAIISLLVGVATRPLVGAAAFIAVGVASVSLGIVLMASWPAAAITLRPATSRFVRVLVLTWLPFALAKVIRADRPAAWFAGRPLDANGIYSASRLERAVGYFGGNLNQILGVSSVTFAFGIALELLALCSPSSWW